MQETRVQSLGWEDHLEKRMAITPVSLPGESHGQRGLVGYSPWGCMTESDMTELLTLSFSLSMAKIKINKNKAAYMAKIKMYIHT